MRPLHTNVFLPRAALPALLVASLFVCGCGDHDHPPPVDKLGKVALNLQLPNGTNIDGVKYEIELDGDTVRQGRMPIDETGKASVTEAELVAADGYQAHLTATRLEPTKCVAKRNFVVREGQIDILDVVFQCVSIDDATEASH